MWCAGKTQASSGRLFKNRGSDWRYFDFLPGPVKAFTIKEIKTFLRDQTQWSQLFLIAALVVIYVYNFKVLPIDKSPIKTIYLQNMFSFLNMGLALFVLTAVSARFAYPDFKAENPTQTVTSFGGLVFMLICAGYIGAIILLEAGPVYILFMADIRGKIISPGTWIWIVGSFCAVFVFSIMAITLPMRFGEKRLSKLRI